MDKAREARARRWARRLGYKLVRSRTRRVHYDDHGRYMLVMTDQNSVVAGDRYTAELSEIEAYLASDEARQGGTSVAAPGRSTSSPGTTARRSRSQAAR